MITKKSNILVDLLNNMSRERDIYAARDTARPSESDIVDIMYSSRDSKKRPRLFSMEDSDYRMAFGPTAAQTPAFYIPGKTNASFYKKDMPISVSAHEIGHSTRPMYSTHIENVLSGLGAGGMVATPFIGKNFLPEFGARTKRINAYLEDNKFKMKALAASISAASTAASNYMRYLEESRASEEAMKALKAYDSSNSIIETAKNLFSDTERPTRVSEEALKASRNTLDSALKTYEVALPINSAAASISSLLAGTALKNLGAGNIRGAGATLGASIALGIPLLQSKMLNHDMLPEILGSLEGANIPYSEQRSQPSQLPRTGKLRDIIMRNIQRDR